MEPEGDFDEARAVATVVLELLERCVDKMGDLMKSGNDREYILVQVAQEMEKDPAWRRRLAEARLLLPVLAR